MERYVINRNTFLSGDTNFDIDLAAASTVNPVKTFYTDIHIPVQIPMSHTPIGLSESISNLVSIETKKRINPFIDGEQVAYKYTDLNGCTVNFRFYNKNTGNFELDYEAVGFNTTTGLTKNSFLKSYFRLYFYDQKGIENRNLILFEELDLIGSTQPSLKLKRIYFSRNYKDFVETNNNKDLFVIGRFFNAATGKVHDFMNLPLSYNSPINITQYSQNIDWWTSPVMIINPKNNNGNYNFTLIPFIGGNTTNTMTLTEQIIL